METISWLSEKGGTGKTTSALNASAALARTQARVLLVDTDPQANATLVMLEGQPAEGVTLFDVLLDRCPARDAIRKTRFACLDLLPASVSLADANVALAGEVGRENRLKLAMKTVDQDYDYVMIDTSPQRSILTVNVLNYVRHVIVPVDPGIFSLSGLGQLQQAVADVVKYLNNDRLEVLGLVLTRTQRNNVSRDVEHQLRELFGPKVFDTTIPHSIKVEEAHGRFISVLDYAPKSTGAVAYQQLVEEIVSRVRKEDRPGASAGQPPAPHNRTPTAG